MKGLYTINSNFKKKNSQLKNFNDRSFLILTESLLLFFIIVRYRPKGNYYYFFLYNPKSRCQKSKIRIAISREK